MFLKLAWLNLVKHRKRTFLIIFAVMMSVLVMELVAGMFVGMKVNFFRNLTQEGGHLQINAAGWKERLNPFSLDYTLTEYEQLEETLLSLDGVENAEPVLQFGALVQNGERDVAMVGMGIQPDTGFFNNVRSGLVEGEFLPDTESVLISAENAELLRLKLGDAVNVVVEDSTGSPFYYQYTVAGLFRSKSREFDENTFFITHAAAQDLVYLPGETTEIRVRLTDSETAPLVKEAAVTALTKSGRADELLIQTWRELNEGITVMLEMMDFFIFFMDFFVIIVVATVITNAILMNVFERIREFGTLRSIGLKKKQLATMVLAEGFLQGVIGGLLGLAVGIPIVLYFTTHGLDWGGISEAMGMGSSQFYFGYSGRSSLISLASGVFIALAGSLYAARTATKLSIMDALRYV